MPEMGRVRMSEQECWDEVDERIRQLISEAR